MASIIEGYSYDVFISYRQKDNKGDRWVSEFVESLRTELESTSKEDISIYFDENPHDGLLETQDVDATLKEKLKCLIFIPILSRTYCDPRAFAWEHEFKAFLKQESAGSLGLKVTLPNGNVSSRILPVRIHELEAGDTKLVESILGGVVRGIDFIYKAPGVNRPLRLREEHPADNVNKTYYRDQINKVANSIDNIIQGLLIASIAKDKNVTFVTKIEEEKTEGSPAYKISRLLKSRLSVKNLYRMAIAVALIAASVLGYRYLNHQGNMKSVALIPFDISMNNTLLLQRGDNLLEDVYNKLRDEEGIIVRSWIGSIKYRNTLKSASTLRRELKANYILIGNINAYSDNFEVNMELVRARDRYPVMYKKYSEKSTSGTTISDMIVRDIISGFATSFDKVGASKESEPLPSGGIYSHIDYMSANEVANRAMSDYLSGNTHMESASYKYALGRYDDAIRSDSMFAPAYVKRAITRALGVHTRQLDSSHIKLCLDDIYQAIAIDGELPEIQNALGLYYYYCEVDNRKAIEHFNIAAGREPENYHPLFYMAMVYRNMGDWSKSQEYIKKIMKLQPAEALFLTNIGLSYLYLHKYDSAVIFHQKAIDANPAWRSSYINKLEALVHYDGNTARAWKTLRDGESITGKKFTESRARLYLYDRKFSEAFETAENASDSDFDVAGGRFLMLAELSRYLGRSSDALRYCNSAIESITKVNGLNPTYPPDLASLAMALSGKGAYRDAVEMGIRAVEIASGKGMIQPDVKLTLAKIYVMSGEYDNALKLVEELISSPSGLSLSMLLTDPAWKPLRSLPRFESITRNKKV